MSAQVPQQQSAFVLARLKYSGGGDWYNDPSSIPNLLNFMDENTNIRVGSDEAVVEVMDEELFMYPVIFMTGHGRIAFSGEEVTRLRHYLTSGGFLYADDDYGMDESFRKELTRIFPQQDLIELPFSHDIYRWHFGFSDGPTKIHEHDGGPPQAFGLFHEGRMVIYYTFNTNISDGWADADVHNDPVEIRQKALQMGTNILVYALTR
jgi:CubicO group peptidase (beta-lactamase class C family)